MPEQTAPNSTGQETLEERIKSWEREKRGFIDDLKSEREKRHAMEKELEEIRNALNSAAKEPEDQNLQREVDRLAQQPKEYIREVVKPLLDERDKEIDRLRSERKAERAYQWLAKQEKKDVDDLYGSELEKEIIRISKDHGMRNMDIEEGTKAAYKIYQQERREREEEEARRNQTISNNSTHAVRTPPSSGTPRFTRQQISAMSRAEFDQKYNEIKEAERLGLIS